MIFESDDDTAGGVDTEGLKVGGGVLLKKLIFGKNDVEANLVFIFGPNHRL